MNPRAERCVGSVIVFGRLIRSAGLRGWACGLRDGRPNQSIFSPSVNSFSTAARKEGASPSSSNDCKGGVLSLRPG